MATRRRSSPVRRRATCGSPARLLAAERALQAHRRIIAALHQIAALALCEQPLPAVLQEVAQEVSVATGFPIVAIEFYDPTEHCMEVVATMGIPLPADQAILRVPVNQTLSGLVAQSGQTVVETHAQERPENVAAALRQHSVQTVVCLPLIVADQVMTPASARSAIGALTLAHPGAIPLDPDLVPLAQSLAHAIATLVARHTQGQPTGMWAIIRDITERRRAENLVAAQRDLARLLATVSDPVVAWPRCLALAVQVCELDCGGIYLFDADTQVLDLVAHQGLAEEFVQATARYQIDTANAQLLLAGKAVYWSGADLHWPEVFRLDTLTCAAVMPISAQGLVLGCVNLGSHTLPEVPAFARRALETIATEIGNVVVALRTVATLREREEFYRSLVDSQESMIGTLDIDGAFHFINAIGAALLAGSPAGVVGRRLHDFFPPDIAARQLQQIQQVLASGQGRVVEMRVTRLGAPRWYRTSIQPIRDATGTPVLAMVNALDVTEQRQAEEQLRESQIQVVLAVSGADLGTWDWHVPSSQIVFNERWAEIVGYTLAELAPVSIQTWRDLCHPDDLQRAEALLQQNFARASDRYECEIRMRHKGGAWVWVNTRGKVVEWDAAGAPVRMAGTHLDITARKQAELNVHRLSQTYRVLSAVNAAIIHVREPQALFEAACRIAVEHGGFRMAWVGLVDSQTRRVYPVASAGATAQYLEGLNIDLDDPVRGRGPTATAVHTGTCQVVNAIAYDLQMTPWRANAMALGYQSSAAFPLIVAGTVAGVMNLYAPEPDSFDTVELRLYDEMALDLAFALEGIAREEQRQQLEEALCSERNSLAQRVDARTAELSRANAELARAVRAKDEFLAMMSHELRSPLTAILGYSESLQDGVYDPLTQRQQRAISHIETSGRHLLALINDILDLAKVEAGRLDLQREVISIADVCQASLLFVREIAVKQRLYLDFQVNDQAAQMSADPRRLKQILVNLLSNAVKFTEAGGQVRLAVVADAEAGVVTFAVQDSGIGIAPEDMARLFQPFTQLDSRLSRQHSGTGLGLSLVRRLAELHGGSVSVESAPGVGSRFTVALPYTPAGAASNLAPVLPASTASLHSALVIEDSAVARQQIARYLGEFNIHATIYPNGAGALEEVACLCPDVIILDLLIPGESGWELLARLKVDAALRAIPVIIVSVVDERAQGLAAGAVAYLVKPITREGLRQALELAAARGEPPREPAREAAIIAPAISPVVNSVRILLAEDNDLNISTISDYLQAKGYQLAIARNGREALILAHEVRPNLILMDIQMPELDGLEATRQLRALGAFATTPIIALTALAMPGDRERCLEAGANEYLTKPVSLKRLVETIQRLL